MCTTHVKIKGDDVNDSFYEKLGYDFDQFPRNDTKVLFGDFKAKIGRENTLKPTIGKESLHEISNDKEVRVVNFATSENLVVRSTMFPHRKFHKYTWTSPEGNTHNQIDHILIDRRQHSSILDVRYFRGADCDTDHYLVVAKVRERLAVGKQAARRSNFKKLNEDVKEQYEVTIRNTFAALETTQSRGDFYTAWGNIRENTKFRSKRV
jgi:hypothetical protein